MKHISITAFGRFPVPLPPLPEQKEIVHRLDKLLGIADRTEQRIVAASTLATDLTSRILGAAFTGELVPTEAELARAEGRDYESAEQLLERIGAHT